MKVLYLAPTRDRQEELTPFSFLDEEIIGLADSGLHIYLVTYSLGQSETETKHHPRVHLAALAEGRRARDLLQTLRFLWRVRKIIPFANWLKPRTLYHLARIERFAAEVVERENIEVIHSNFGYPGGFGGVLARAVTGKPLLAMLRGMDVLRDDELGYGLRRDSSYDRALRVLLGKADVTAYVSEFVRRRAIHLGAREATARVIRKGVDCARFTGERASPAGNGCPVILSVAGLIKRKGVHHILESLALLRDSHDFRFIAAGKGEELESLQAQCDDFGLGPRSTFVGQVSREKVPELFAACDIFVLGSIWEASGNVLLEAMASARPVVCTASGGPPEYIIDGETGFVVPPADPGAMAERIRTLLDDPALRETLGRAGRERALAHLSYPRMIENITRVYLQLAER